MSDLKSQLIKLGTMNPELQPHIRPILDRGVVAQGGALPLHRLQAYLREIGAELLKIHRDIMAGNVDINWPLLAEFVTQVDVDPDDYESDYYQTTITYGFDPKSFNFEATRKVHLVERRARRQSLEESEHVFFRSTLLNLTAPKVVAQKISREIG